MGVMRYPAANMGGAAFVLRRRTMTARSLTQTAMIVFGDVSSRFMPATPSPSAKM